MTDGAFDISRLLDQLLGTASSLLKEIEREVREYFTGDGAIDRLLAKLLAICVWIVAIILELSWQSPTAKVVSLSMTGWASSLWGLNGNPA